MNADEYYDPSRVEYNACPLCGNTDLEVVHDQDWSWRPDFDARLHPTIRWVGCPACDHQLVWGYHTPESLAIIFGQAQASQTPTQLTSQRIEAQRLVWSKVTDAVSLHRPTGRWLDVGAGAGMLAAVAYECGYEVAVVETRDLVADALRAHGFDVIASDVMDLRALPDEFDVISLCDVLEHVPFPHPVLEVLSRALRAGGVLFVSAPNRDSLAWRALDQEGVNPYWSEIEHYHNFTFRRLRSLLAEHGFEVVSCSVSNRYRVGMEVVATKVG